MAPGRARDEQKERQWRRWIDLWQSSGLTVAAFCARHRLTTASFYAWRRTLKRRHTQSNLFVPVQLLHDDHPPPPSTLDVILADGRIVRVRAGFDAPTLRRLLAVLQEQPSC